MVIFSFLKSQKIAETKMFSEISGFSFEYPVFKGWEVKEVKKVNENSYIIFLKNPTNFGFNVGPEINIEKGKIGLISQGIGNPQGFPYYIKDNILTFYDSENSIKISYFTGSEKQGFARKISFDKIIETFKFSNCSPESIGAALLSKFTGQNLNSQNEEIYLKAKGAEAVVEKLKQDKESPDDFYATTKVVEKSGLNGYLITYHLLHKDDFNPENCNKLGNPSGKGRDMVYDTNQEKIIKDLLRK